MRLFALFLLSFLIASPAICISVEDLGRLALLRTEDELILEMIHIEGVDRPISAKDVIYLKERGLSERVIEYLWKQSFQDKEFLPPQEGESEMIGENLRSYTSTDKSGKKIQVLTNLDEDGRRMGPPPPPAPERYSQAESTYTVQPLQQNYPTISSQNPAWAQMQSAQPATISIPFYNNGYYPYYSVFSFNPYPIFNPHCKPIWGKYGTNVHSRPIWPGMSRTIFKR